MSVSDARCVILGCLVVITRSGVDGGLSFCVSSIECATLVVGVAKVAGIVVVGIFGIFGAGSEACSVGTGGVALSL